MTAAQSSAVDVAPLVSVIMPSYNHVRYIERAIASVLTQRDVALELVVIDDGSTDGSPDFLRLLSERHKFVLICQENQGICRTLNRAIRESAKGNYVALLASDDFWHPEKLQLQLKALVIDYGSEFCFSQAVEFQNEERAEDGRVFPARCGRGNMLKRVFVRQHVPAGTMLFTRRLYDELGGFDETLKEEDWDFVIRSAAATRFSAVDRPLLYYRAHPANTMRTRSGRAIFHEKAKILAKNFPLVPAWLWLLAVGLHFMHDIVFGRLARR